SGSRAPPSCSRAPTCPSRAWPRVADTRAAVPSRVRSWRVTASRRRPSGRRAADPCPTCAGPWGRWRREAIERHHTREEADVDVTAAWAILTGVLEIVAAVRLRRELTGEWRLVLSGVLSIVFGVLVMLAPGAGALAMVLLIGAYSIVFGALLLALAQRLRRLSTEHRVPIVRAA